MYHLKDFISFFLVLLALICIVAMFAGFFLAIGMRIAEIFLNF